QHLPQRFRIQSLSASFAAPVPLDRVVSCTTQLQGTELSAHLECGERRTTVVRAAFTSDDLESLAPLPQVAPLPIESPMETRPEEIANARGAFTLQLDPTHAAELFPS